MLFLDWHLALGHEITLQPPTDPVVAQQLADMGVLRGPSDDLVTAFPHERATGAAMFPLSAVKVDIRSGAGRVVVDLVDGRMKRRGSGEPS